MMLIFILAAVLPSYVLPHITINILATPDSATLTLAGYDENLISIVEQDTFQITDIDIKKTIAEAVGVFPTHIFLKGPTPWDDLYKRYGWKQVSRKITPINARTTKIHSQSVVVAKKIVMNKNKHKKMFNVSLVTTLQDTKTIWWKRNGLFEVKDDITFNLLFEDSNLLTFSTRWGQDFSVRQNVTIGSRKVELVLEPGQMADVSLFVNHGFLEIEIDYVSEPDGQVACNFKDKFYGHHFWGFYIKTIMEYGGTPINITVTQILRLEFYTNAKIVASTMVNILDEPAYIYFEDDDVTTSFKHLNSSIQVNDIVANAASHVVSNKTYEYKNIGLVTPMPD